MKKLLIVIISLIIILFSSVGSYAVLPSPISCETNEYCNSYCCDATKSIDAGPYCSCNSSSICEDHGRGKECYCSVKISTNLTEDFFKSKAENYIVSNVGNEIYKNRYLISNIDNLNYATDVNYVYIDPETGEHIDAGSVAIGHCSGNVMGTGYTTIIIPNLYISEININRSQAIDIAVSKGMNREEVEETATLIHVGTTGTRNSTGQFNVVNDYCWVFNSKNRQCYLRISALDGSVKEYDCGNQINGNESKLSPTLENIIIMSFAILFVLFTMFIIYRYKKIKK